MENESDYLYDDEDLEIVQVFQKPSGMYEAIVMGRWTALCADINALHIDMIRVLAEIIVDMLNDEEE